MDQGLVEPRADKGVRLDLRVSGMHCASCVRRVERAAAAVPGVRSVAVNLATEHATVTADSTLSLPKLAAAIGTAGFQVALPEQADAPPHRSRDGLWAGLALLLAAPLVLPMALMPFGVHADLPPLAQLVLAAVIQLGFSARFYRGAWQAARAGAGSMDTLVALGTTAAFGLSVVELLAGRNGHLYFEASAAVIALVRLGKFLEARSRRQAGAAIRALVALRPAGARIRQGAAERDIPVGELLRGDTLVVRPGERVAADAVVREGVGSADESLLTGESLPVAKAPGERLIGGSINGHARLLAEVTAVGAESRLARMVRLVEDAQGSKPPVQRLVDRISAAFVPAVVGLAVLTALGWWLAGAGMETSVVNAVAVLVIACPCALGLATPAAIMVGTGVAARHGILIRDGAALERAGGLRTVVFDKTGTLTTEPALVAIHPAAGLSEVQVLRTAAALTGSGHSLERAIRLRAEGLSLPPASGLRALPGRGVEAVVEGRVLLLGSLRLMQESGVATGNLAGNLAGEGVRLAAAGHTVSYLAERDGPLLGMLGFGDSMKAGAAEAVAVLRRSGLHVVLLTGDGAGAAADAAGRLGIEDVRAQALPEDKARIVADLRAGGGVAMVGDGVNDAAALAAADLGMAMATGTEAAMAAADITLLHGDPRLVPAALDIARRTTARIRGGLFWAFAYNVVGLPLAAAGLLSPVVAGAAMALSSVAVMANALLLRRWRPADAAP